LKAAVFYEPQVPVTVEDLELEAPKAGEVSVQMVNDKVCHSDYHMVDGHLLAPGIPYVMGHEGAGVLTEVGPTVNAISPSDKIIFSMDAMCGHYRNCSEGHPPLCENYERTPRMPDGRTRFSKDGKPYYHNSATFSGRTVVLADKLVKVPADTPFDKAFLIACAVITEVGAMVNRAKVQAGSTMAVYGCGGVGLDVV
jgi:S-(hydroxymethyl)glutathione dehydrogenase/alcohol dehydrogenase